MRNLEQQREADSRRNAWLLSMPALVVLTLAAVGPLTIVLIYSFLTPGEYGNVVWKFSTAGWTSVLYERDIFDGTLKLADANLTIFSRSVKLSFLTTILTFLVGFPTAWFIATRPPRVRALWLFLITIPFWTNLLIRTFAINQIIRNEGVLNTFLLKAGIISAPIQLTYT
ncbi:MAG: ABC transporter permease, partial [Proteobacteria bacterium]|nr:ABC transporter permease [Pseudomonadota bacterium]